MFRQLSIFALVSLAALGSLAVATAQESKEAGSKTQSPPKECRRRTIFGPFWRPVFIHLSDNESNRNREEAQVLTFVFA